MTRNSILMGCCLVVSFLPTESKAQESPSQVVEPIACTLGGSGQFPTIPTGGPPQPTDQPCPDVFASNSSLKLILTSGEKIELLNLQDLQTVIGRSPAGQPKALGTICEGGSFMYPDTASAVPDCFLRPFPWPQLDQSNGGCEFRWELHTEMLSLELFNNTGPIRVGTQLPQACNAWVRAAQPYFNRVRGTPQERFFNNSIGEVRSLYPGGPPPGAPPPLNPNCCDEEKRFKDFSADSLFNVFVEVELDRTCLGLPMGFPDKFYNKTPILAVQRKISMLPGPGLPVGTYLHSTDFGATPIFDENGIFWGSLLSAGHGGGAGAFDPPAEALQRVRGPVSFTVDNLSLGLNTGATPNDVLADTTPERPLTMYLSSGATAQQPPDLTNRRDPPLVGVVGGQDGFVGGPMQDMINSFSFGRDGTVNLEVDDNRNCAFEVCEGILHYSVSRGSQGVCGSDVFYNRNETGTIHEEAADMYTVTALGIFGQHFARNAGFAPPLPQQQAMMIMAVDNTAFGLRPDVIGPDQDNITGLEVDNFRSKDFWYGTFLIDPASSAFPGSPNSATIYSYDPASGPFQPSNLDVFATPDTMGLDVDDVIDALVLSDITRGSPPPCPQIRNRTLDACLPANCDGFDEVLFSLAPGSPSLAGRSPADIFVSNFDTNHRLFQSNEELGLLDVDDVNALDIQCVEADNDDCEDGTALRETPQFFWHGFGSTDAATVDNVPACGGVPIDQPGAWHTIQTTADKMMRAFTCASSTTDYNTRLSVFCGDCKNSTCIVANDDKPAGSPAGCSEVEWCAKAGQLYRILVHGSDATGAASATGRYRLSVIISGNCPSPPTACQPPPQPTGACCLTDAFGNPVCGDDFPPGNCALFNGIYRGDGRRCAGDANGNGEDDACEINNCPPACTWFQPADNQPGLQHNHAMVYDEVNRVVTMFGGTGNNNRTWEWNGVPMQWTERFPPPPLPPGRGTHAMAYNADTGNTVLFGGRTASFFDDTWLWDNNVWTQVFPTTTPPARWAHSMAYDAVNRVVVMYGGLDTNSATLGDMWTWNGTNWVQRFPAASPGPRSSFAMAYDNVRNVIVLYGGSPGLNETWEWDGANWTQRFPANNPGNRSGHAMAFDRARGVSVLFGGNSFSSNLNTWEYDGDDWREIVLAGPTPRFVQKMAYDAANRQTVLYGGLTAGGVVAETWLYPEESVTQGYCISGTSTGTGWSWCATGVGFNVCDPFAPGVSVGGSSAALADRFVQSINDRSLATGCTGLSATTISNAPDCFLINACGGQAFELGVGSFGQMPDCFVASDKDCTFNPVISMIPLSKEDCNGNGVDDKIDLEVGNLQDLDGDGSVDSCEPVRLFVAPKGVDPALFFASPTFVTVQPGDTLLFDVYVENTAVGLQTYEVTLDNATGGSSGSVTYQTGSTAVDQSRGDWVHAGLNVITGVVQGPPPQFGSVILAGVPPIVSLQPKYCGELTYQVSNDALGTFSIDFVAPGSGVFDDTFLAGSSGPRIDFVAESLIVEVESLCLPSTTPQPDMILNAQGTLEVSTMNRYLAFTAGDAGRLQALRVTFVSLPPPFDVWNGATLWVDTPQDECESGSVGPGGPCPSGFALFKAARLQCSGPVYLDWNALGVIHVFHEGLVPGGAYDVDVIDMNCSTAFSGNFSTPLSLATARWGDCCGPFDSGNGLFTAPDGTVGVPVDTVALLDKFTGQPSAPAKARADLEPMCVDLKINISDIVLDLDAFRGFPYPFVPSAADPCQSTCP